MTTWTNLQKRDGQTAKIYNSDLSYDKPSIYNGKSVEVWTNQTKN